MQQGCVEPPSPTFGNRKNQTFERRTGFGADPLTGHSNGLRLEQFGKDTGANRKDHDLDSLAINNRSGLGATPPDGVKGVKDTIGQRPEL